MAYINDKKAKLIFVGGQSNPFGTDTLFTDLSAAQLSVFPTAKVKMFVSGNFVDMDANTTITLGSEFGPELGMASWIQLNKNETVYCIKYAVGSTSFQAGDWNPGNATYEAALAQANLAIAKLVAMDYIAENIEVIFIWGQGESDATTEEDGNAYQAAEAAMFADLDSRLDATITKIINWKLSVNQTTLTHKNNVNAGKTTNAASDSRIVLFNTNMFCSTSGTGVHYDSDSQWEIGQRMARIVFGETIKSVGEQMGYDAVVSTVCGEGDYTNYSLALDTEGAGANIYVKAGTYTLSSDVVYQNNQNIVHEIKGSGVILDGDSAYSIVRPTVTTHNIYPVTPSPSGSTTVITATGSDLSAEAANPTAYKIAYYGEKYDVIAADDDADTITVNAYIANSSGAGKVIFATTNFIENLTLSGKLTVINCDETISMKSLYYPDFKDLILDVSGCGVQVIMDQICGGDLGTIIYSNSTTGDFHLISTTGTNFKMKVIAVNNVKNSANNRAAIVVYSGTEITLDVNINNNINNGAGAFRGIYTSSNCINSILRGNTIQNDTNLTSDGTSAWNVTQLYQ